MGLELMWAQIPFIGILLLKKRSPVLLMHKCKDLNIKKDIFKKRSVNSRGQAQCTDWGKRSSLPLGRWVLITHCKGPYQRQLLAKKLWWEGLGKQI